MNSPCDCCRCQTERKLSEMVESLPEEDQEFIMGMMDHMFIVEDVLEDMTRPQAVQVVRRDRRLRGRRR